eukprot:g13804.t1
MVEYRPNPLAHNETLVDCSICLVLVGSVEGVGDATKVAKILQTECNVSELAVELNVVAVQFLKEAENARDLQQLGPSHLHRSIDAMNFHIVVEVKDPAANNNR